MATESPSPTEITKSLENVLQTLPDVEVESKTIAPSGCNRLIDLELMLRFRNNLLVRVLVDIKQNSYPRDLRESIWQLQQHAAGCEHHEDGVPTILLVAAPSISQSGRELLRKNDVGYCDESGSFYLKSPWFLFLIDRPPNKKTEPRQLQSTYRGSAAQVVHALLLEPNKAWHVGELAEHAQVSPYTVHHVFQFLEAQLWVEKRGAGPKAVRILREPRALLNAYAEDYSLDRYRFHRFHRWAQSPRALLKSLTDVFADRDTQYALTLESGAQLVAPFASDEGRISVILSEGVDVESIAREAGLKPVDSGETVQFLLTRDRSPLLFRQQVDNIWIASSIQLYLDLHAWPRRGKEQAEHLRSIRIPY